ncbi:MAG: FtsX-like permease family protein [Gammaproteobacteria bacterium]
MPTALHKKLLRDLFDMRGQALAIAMVIAAGAATYIMSVNVYQALSDTRHQYYERQRFADVFASLTRAPENLARRIEMIPGVDRVQTRVVAAALIDVPGFDDPVTGRLVSIPDDGEPLLNSLHLRRGRLPEPGRDDEVLVSEAFATAHGLEPGDRLSVLIKGRYKTVSLVGVALSPEFIYQIAPGRILPDFKRYGVLWMAHKPLAAAYEMEEGFNDVLLGLTPDASAEPVIERLDLLLEPNGGLGAFGREDQISHKFLNEEFRQLRQTAGLFSGIFLGITAFLLNVVIGRLVNTQREQIAILKAFGYRNTQIGWHFLQLVLVIVALGVAAGTGFGAWLGAGLSEIYMDYYRFPFLRYRIHGDTVIVAALVTGIAAITGTLGAVRQAARLPPAEAMRPAAPETYKPSWLERAGFTRRLDQPSRMILRHLSRRPVKTTLTVAGIAMACGVMMLGTFFTDAMDEMVEIEFGQAQREDLAVTFYQATSLGAVYELHALEGVNYVEPFRNVPVRLRAGSRSYRTSISGYRPDAVLHRALDDQLQPLKLPDEGLLLTEQLAEILSVATGDSLQVEVLEGRRTHKDLSVAGVVRQYIGIGAYTSLDGLNRLMGEGYAVSGAYLAIDSLRRNDILRHLKSVPRVAATESSDSRLQNFYDSIAEFLLTYMGFISALSAAIVFGIVYNSARIALAERGRDLASLRVLGFTRGEVSYILLGELGLLTLLAILPGFAVGYVLSAWMVSTLPHELFRIPLVLERDTYALAAAVVLGAAVVSGLVVRRRVDQLDMVAALKTRE